MKYDIVGAMLIFTSAFLYAARYIAAAILLVGSKRWGAGLFEESYGYVGTGVTNWSKLALIAGLGAIVAGALVDSRRQGIEHNKPDGSDA